MFIHKFIYFFSLLCLSFYTWADFGIALNQVPKYKQGFKYFDYVNPDAPKKGSITIPSIGSFDSLNPFSLKGKKEIGVSLLTIDTLMIQSEDEPFAMYGLIADDIKLAIDRLSVTFHINPLAKFHNGDPILAKDVIYSFKTLTEDPAANPLFRFYWAGVSDIKEINSSTVQFIFKEKNPELHLILGQLPIFSHKSFPKGLAQSSNVLPIGSGPYQLKKVMNNKFSEYQLDPNYWAKNIPTRKGMFNFKNIRIKYYLDETAQLEALKSGQFDIHQENTARLWARAYPEQLLDKHHLKKSVFPHHRDVGLQGFVINLRKKNLQNLPLRQALILSYDFESVNRLLFYGLYHRSDSFFTNTELAAHGLPDKAELRLLKPLAAKLPPELFTQEVPMPPVTNKELGIRPNLVKARDILLSAGFYYQNGKLYTPDKKNIVLEYLTYSKNFERSIVKWKRDLAKIGIELKIRVVDRSLYQKRVNDFDFDLITEVYANTQSPGNEQFHYHSCQAAKTTGSYNYAGICHPAIEKLLPNFINFNSRQELVTASKALDRVLRWQYFIVPNYHSRSWYMIYRDNLKQPKILPLYYFGLTWAIQTWWYE